MNQATAQSAEIKIGSWQQWSTWLARTGYSELEHSTLMTLQQVNRAKIVEVPPVPARIYAAALRQERMRELERLFESAESLLMTVAD